MGGFNPPVPQQDSNWEIRVAVLLSLLFQVLLVFAGPLRKRTSHRVTRFAIWSCYLLADWVADLALGLLLSNMGNIGGSRSGGSSSSSTSGVGGHTSMDSSSPVIFAFWAPFLLLHLGGQDTITAYSIEDNELWLRHLVGLLFELFSAAVIFLCSLQGNYTMILATVLMFVVGIIKYGERTYSLYSSSVDGILDNILRDPDPGTDYAKLMAVFGAKERAGLPVDIVIANGEAKKELDALEQGQQDWLVERWITKNLEARAHELFRIFRRVSYDVTLSYKERKISQAYFLDRRLKPTEAFEVIEVELNFLYDMVHTKAPVAHTKKGLALRFVGSGCLVSALAIFFLLDKQGSIQRVDVGITYALLLGGLVLDAAALSMLLCSNWTLVFLEDAPRLAWLARAIRLLRSRLRQRRWSERTSQMNLISYCLGKPDGKDDEGGGHCSNCCFVNQLVTRALAKVPEKLRAREIFHDFFFIRRERLSCRKQQGEEEPFLLEFIFEGFKKAAMKVKGKAKEYQDEGVLVHDKELREQIELMLTVATKQKEAKKLTEATRGEQRDLDEAELAKKTMVEKLHGVLVGSLKRAMRVKGKEYQDMKDTFNYRGEGVLVHDKELPGEIELKLKEATRGEQRDLDEAELAKKTMEKIDILLDSIRRDFDESLLLWHIATDLCWHLPLPQDSALKKDTIDKMKPIGKTLSEYMLYLLIKQPKMLSASAGVGHMSYRDTCAEARRFFQSANIWDPDHADARRMLLGVNTSKRPAEVKGDRSMSVLFDACILAKVLRELGGDLMWEVVARVWREMLTYAAQKCKGSTHVQQLSRGGELMTIVWFLMAHVGIGDMYEIQRRDGTPKIIVHDQ